MPKATMGMQVTVDDGVNLFFILLPRRSGNNLTGKREEGSAAV